MRMVIVEVLKVNNKSSKLIIRMTGCVIYWTHNVLLCKESRNYLSKKRSDVIISKSKVLTGKKISGRCYHTKAQIQFTSGAIKANVPANLRLPPASVERKFTHDPKSASLT